MKVQPFYDELTNTLTYAVFDPATGDAVIIDPVLDFEPRAGRVYEDSIDKLAAFMAEHRLRLRLVLETHAHADHLSGAQALKRRFEGVEVGIGARIGTVQDIFKRIYDLPSSFPTDGSQFDRLFEDDEIVVAGSLKCRVLFTPGHTPACVSYLFDHWLFCGDLLFMPDGGTGRCDFPGGDARATYRSVTHRIFALPDDVEVHVGHDYPAEGRPWQHRATVGDHKRNNVHINAHTREEQFVEFRGRRDRSLPMPWLLIPSVQVNIAGGRLPEPSTNGLRYLKLPLNAFEPVAMRGPMDGTTDGSAK